MSDKNRVNGAAEEQQAPQPQPQPNKNMVFAVPPEVFDDLMNLVKAQKIEDYGKLWIKLQTCRPVNIQTQQAVNV